MTEVRVVWNMPHITNGILKFLLHEVYMCVFIQRGAQYLVGFCLTLELVLCPLHLDVEGAHFLLQTGQFLTQLSTPCLL